MSYTNKNKQISLTTLCFYVNLISTMVNTNNSITAHLSTKASVLSILRKNTGTLLSGEKIADSIGKSRVSVWKAIQGLEEAGYGIVSSTEGRKRGYILVDDLKDALYEWEFGESEKHIRYFDTIDSTMNEAKRIALEKTHTEDDFYIIVADTQTSGRGTKHKKWESQKQGLYFTLLVTTELETHNIHILTSIAQIALVKTLNAIIKKSVPKEARDNFQTLKPFQLRWPNDIWINQKKGSIRGKVAGILTEYLSSGNLIEWCSLGIGLNIESNASDEKIVALNDILNLYNIDKVIERKDIIHRFLQEFKDLFSMIHKSSKIKKRWNLYCSDIGKSVKIKNEKDSYLFEGIDSYGWALLSNGKRIPPGEKQIIKD